MARAPKVTSTKTTVRQPLGMNGMVEVAIACNGCDGCRAGARCEKPWSGVQLPDPCCSGCGHDPHDGLCPGCPCAKRAWGWEKSAHSAPEGVPGPNPRT